MIYGYATYEGTTRECEACGHASNEHTHCAHCEQNICVYCADVVIGNDCYCSEACAQEKCEHVNVRYECGDDVDEGAGYAAFREEWTCRDCGAALEEDRKDEVLVPKKPARQMCVNCKTHVVRWNSIYCSEACRREFLTFPEAA